jgi:DNA-binding NarL/FixJ family response regulator
MRWMANPSWGPWRSLKAEALGRLGREGEAVELLEEELEIARLWGAPGTIGTTLRRLGEIRQSDGVAELEEAIELLEAAGMRVELARALSALGGIRRRERRQSDAREPLRRAYELAEGTGASALAAEIRTELHATGARPRSSALSGPESLTASERRVADQATEGKTNKEIAQALYVTPKTVEVHLSNAYRKLDISSRRELAGALAAPA